MAGDVCSRPPININSHDLHLSNVKGAMGEITSYHNNLTLSLFYYHVGCASLGLYLAFLFCFPCDGFDHRYIIRFFVTTLVIQILNTYTAKQCSHVEFPYFVMGSHLGQQHRPH